MEGGDAAIHTWNLRISCEIAVICHWLFMTRYAGFFLFFSGLLFYPHKGFSYHYYGFQKEMFSGWMHTLINGRNTKEGFNILPICCASDLAYSFSILSPSLMFSITFCLCILSKRGKLCRKPPPLHLSSHLITSLSLLSMSWHAIQWNTIEYNLSCKDF